MVPSEVNEWLRMQGHGKVISSRGVGGGCINNGAVLNTFSGKSFFLKTNRSAPRDMFACEAEGLNALRVSGGPIVPASLLVGENFLLLEDLAPAPRQADYWEAFGRQLALLHNTTAPRFGFKNDNYIGNTPQPNAWMEDGYAFFAERRLNFQAQLAQRRGLLSNQDAAQVIRLSERLIDLVPCQPASLIHGDLWSGNALTDSQGKPAIIDPAAYYGWAEAELAMTVLFGSFPESFYKAYQEVRSLEKDFRQRYSIYNLYHLLNHLNLFGTGYLGQVQSILRLYH